MSEPIDQTIVTLRRLRDFVERQAFRDGGESVKALDEAIRRLTPTYAPADCHEIRMAVCVGHKGTEIVRFGFGLDAAKSMDDAREDIESIYGERVTHASIVMASILPVKIPVVQGKSEATNV